MRMQSWRQGQALSPGTSVPNPQLMGATRGPLYMDHHRKQELTQAGTPTPLNSLHMEHRKKKKALGLIPNRCVASGKSLDVSGP